MNNSSIIVANPTIDSVIEALWLLTDTASSGDQPLTVAILSPSGSLVFTAAAAETVVKQRASNAGIKQRCRTKDAAGRRCVRGPRHSAQHRYENGE